ncbi:hypothetical protein CsSME_00017331 [Camellia sinensis var. sinensis]
MEKIRTIKSMITGEPSDSQLAEMTHGQSFQQATQESSPVLALASEQSVGRLKKRQRWASTEQRLVDEDSTELPSANQGEQTEQSLGELSTRFTSSPV